MFKKIRFCLDSFLSAEKESMKQLIDKEDGLCQDYLDEDVSYLIIQRVGTRNYFRALELNIHIVPPQWLNDSLDKRVLQNPLDYPFKLFHGIVITSTGFDLHERYAMQTEIEMHGGIFERELVFDHTNYLITRNIHSEKYKTAVEWPNVTIVNEDWLSDSVQRGKLQDPIHYQNYTQISTTIKQDKRASSAPVTSFSGSCLSMIEPLDNSYLTPNKTVARTREVDLLLDGFILYLCIENSKTYKRIQSLLTSHGAFCVDTIISSTTLIIAETLTDYQNAVNLIHNTENPSSSNVSSLTGFESTSNQEVDCFSIPIVNTQWVTESHSLYSIQPFQNYQWTKGIFSNLSFFIYEFKRDYETVKRSIEINDGKVVTSMDQASFIVCPRTVDSDIFKDDRAVSAKWLKTCLEAKRLVSRSSVVLYRPFPRLLKDKTLCLTGFGVDDRYKMENYIVALGGKLENTINENLFALICREHVKLNVKMKEAIRLGIPLVSRNWIDWLIVHKEMASLEKYTFSLEREETSMEELENDKTMEVDDFHSRELLPTKTVEVEDLHSRGLPPAKTVEVEALQSRELPPTKTTSREVDGLTKAPESIFLVDCRSNSLATDVKPDSEDPTLLFEEKRDKEVIYTSFNEIFKNTTSSVTSDSQKSILLEKQIQKESQNILSPRLDKPTVSENKSLLQGLASSSGGNLWGKSFLSKNSKRIRLDEEDENNKDSKRVSITALDDDTPKEKTVSSKQRKTKTARKSTRSKKK